MAEKNKGKITQVISAVLDIKFPDGKLPDILNAITIDRGNGETLTAEVSQHLGDDTVRCIAMGSTDWSDKRNGGSRHRRSYNVFRLVEDTWKNF